MMWRRHFSYGTVFIFQFPSCHSNSNFSKFFTGNQFEILASATRSMTKWRDATAESINVSVICWKLSASGPDSTGHGMTEWYFQSAPSYLNARRYRATVQVMKPQQSLIQCLASPATWRKGQCYWIMANNRIAESSRHNPEQRRALNIVSEQQEDVQHLRWLLTTNIFALNTPVASYLI